MAAVAVLPLACCARYTPLPLPQAPRLATSVSALMHPGIDPVAPLSVEQVARLALYNAPDIVSARSQADVAEAGRAVAALPPNPQFSGAFLPLLAGVGSTPAYSVAVAEDIKALITLGARRRAARAAAQQVSAQLAWLAWQTVGSARTLAVDLIEGERSLALLERSGRLFDDRLARSQAALRQGDATLATLAPDLAAAQSARGLLDDLQRQQLQRRHQLNALLGLAPDVMLRLADAAVLPAMDPAAILAALPGLAGRRPDLVALQLGYRAQDQKLRVAILSQFPNFVLGVTGGSDNSNVRNIGPQVAMDIPLFDHNQGGVAVERATRAQLHAEYAARLDAADGLVRASLDEQAQQQRQLDALRQDLPVLARTAADANAAYGSGTLDERSYVDLVSASLARQQQIITAEQALLDSRAALATLVGADLPPLVLTGQGAAGGAASVSGGTSPRGLAPGNGLIRPASTGVSP